jgi:hypothetical protein
MVALGSAKLLFFLIFSSHRVTFQFNPNCIGGEAIHDGVSKGRFIDIVTNREGDKKGKAT